MYRFTVENNQGVQLGVEFPHTPTNAFLADLLCAHYRVVGDRLAGEPLSVRLGRLRDKRRSATGFYYKDVETQLISPQVLNRLCVAVAADTNESLSRLLEGV